jgi:hypothetical protein
VQIQFGTSLIICAYNQYGPHCKCLWFMINPNKLTVHELMIFYCMNLNLCNIWKTFTIVIDFVKEDEKWKCFHKPSMIG